MAGEGQSRPGSAKLHISPSSSTRPSSGALGAPHQKTVRGPYTNDASEVLPPSYSHATGRPSDATRLSPSTPSFPSQSLSINAAPLPERHSRGNFTKPTFEPDPVTYRISRYSPHPTPTPQSLDSDKRTTYDDGIGPLHDFHEQPLISPNVGSLPDTQSNVSTEGLFAKSGLDEHRSVNPNLPFPLPKVIPSSASSNHSPRLGCLESQSLNHSTTPRLTAPDHSFKERTSSRPPSRNDSIYSNSSAADPHSRSSSIQANVNDTVVVPLPSSVTVNLDSSSKTLTAITPSPVGPQGQPSPATLSPSNVNVHKRFSSISNMSLEGRSTDASRSASPAYRADVPHNVESGTDTEPEIDELERPHTKKNILPPAPPPKDSQSTHPVAYDIEADLDTSETSQLDVSEDSLESLRVERMSRSTFIAPALPPIRFSLNTTDFSELLGSVGGIMSLKSLDDIAILTRQKQDDNALAVPSLVPTPTLDTGEENATLSEINSSQALMVGDASPTLLSSQIHNKESSDSKDPGTYSDQTQITITEAESNIAVSLGRNTSDLICKRLQETSNSAKKTGAQHIYLDVSLVDTIIELIESQKAEYHILTGKMEGMNVGNFLFSIAACSDFVEGE